MSKPLSVIKNFGFSDPLRSMKNRVFGFCASVRNLIPTLGDGERVRPGYTPYTGITTQATDPSGNALTIEVIKNCPIQNPSQEDVIFQFGKYTSNQYVYMTPYWITASKQTGNLQINESKTISGIAVKYDDDATGCIMTPSVTTGWSSTNDYYKGWILESVGKFATVTAYNGTSKAITFLERVDASGINLGSTLATPTFLYRSFHGGSQYDVNLANNDGQLTPAYNTGLSEPPSVVADNSRIYLSGGQGSASGNKPIFIDPHLKRTWFSGGTKQLDYEGTYVEREELRPYDFRKRSGNSLVVDAVLDASYKLPEGYTYWLAVAPVYDGYQIGQLYKYETVADYTNSITGANYNYIVSGDNATVKFVPQISLATLNKRITGLLLYAAQDNGQTTSRQSPYYFIRHIKLSPTADTVLGWTWDATIGAYSTTVLRLTGLDWASRGNTYQEDSGCSDSPLDGTVSYSLRTVLGGRHFIANYYLGSSSLADKQSLTTNPVGGNATIGNAGIPQVSIFHPVDGGTTFRAMPTIGSRINAIIPNGGDQLSVLKDMGILIGRVVQIDTVVDVSWNVIDMEVGCTTTNCVASDDEGWIYFPSYKDIHRFRNGQLESLIQKKDGNDWYGIYNDKDYITTTQKEAATIWYQKDIRGVVVNFNNIDNAYINGFNNHQYVFFPDFYSNGWRQIRFNEQSGVSKSSFKYLCKLRDNTIIGLTVEATPLIYILCVNNSGAYIFQDYDGASASAKGIVPYLDTGDFSPSGGDESKNFLFEHLTFNSILLDKIGDGSSMYLTTMGGGNLDISYYLDQNETATPTAQRTASSLSKTATRVNVYSQAGERKLCGYMRIIYNANATPMAMSTTATHKVFGITSVELYGDIVERGKRVGEI